MIATNTPRASGARLSRRRALTQGGANLALAAFAAAGMPASGRRRSATAGEAGEDVAGLVDIGGRSLYLDSRGRGDPTVILESGAGNDSRVWDTVSLPVGSTQEAVFPAVATFTHVCAYDRPGTYLGPGLPGRSDPAPMPRTAGDAVSDLHTLLAAADVPGPYVMVGHSFGGLVVRLYASTYPEDVVGLVLIDAAHEAYYEEIQQVLTPAQWDSFVHAAPDPNYPNIERFDTIASAAEMRDTAMASPLQPMPLVVLTHGQPWDWPPELPAAELEDPWLSLQQDLASLVPNSRLVIAEESGHFIQLQQPDLVIEAVRQVVEAVREPNSWTT